MHYVKNIFIFLCSTLLLFGCFLAAFYAAAVFLGKTRSLADVLFYAIVSFCGFFVFCLFFMLYHFIPHYRYHRSHKDAEHRGLHYAIFHEIEQAIDRIARGDFSIRIDKGKYDTKNSHVTQISDIADRINRMALNLGNMETMRQDFVANVSHEIRSPLTSIRGFASLLKAPDLQEQDRLHYISIIESESLRLSRLSENLLELSALDSGNAEMHRIPYPLGRQLEDIIVLLEPQWMAKHLDVSLQKEAVTVCADRELLSQVWINLINNSIKFTPQGGTISVSVSKKENSAKVVITDSGIGMTEETQAHIFERFYMADKARSRKDGGSGLGLSIAQKIVGIHNGTIRIASTQGKGSSFTVLIPENGHAGEAVSELV